MHHRVPEAFNEIFAEISTSNVVSQDETPNPGYASRVLIPAHASFKMAMKMLSTMKNMNSTYATKKMNAKVAFT